MIASSANSDILETLERLIIVHNVAVGAKRSEYRIAGHLAPPVNTVDLGRYRHSGESRKPYFMWFSGPRLSPG
jgi:hypothetical protein